MVFAGSLDLWVLLVDYTVGNIFLSLVVWALVIMIAGIMGRLSFQSILIILTVYFAVAMVGYIGALAAAPLLIWAIWYMITGVINNINAMR